MKLAALALCGILLAAAPASGTTHHVPSEYLTINKGLDAAAFGDTVLVAPGYYTKSEERNLGFPTRSCAFMKDGVVLLSEGGPEVTTIDMLGAGSAQAAVIWCMNLTSEQTLVRGFTVTGTNPARSDHGAYVSPSGGKMSFRNCIFRDMDAGESTGGGIAAGLTKPQASSMPRRHFAARKANSFYSSWRGSRSASDPWAP
jgi:hypothetical protein